MLDQNHETNSSWEGPVSDSQAVTISDFLLTHQEAEIYLSQMVPTQHTEAPNKAHPPMLMSNHKGTMMIQLTLGAHFGKSISPPRMLSIEYPRNLGGYMQSGEEAYDAYWSAWINEVADADELDRIAIYHHLM